MSRGTQVEVAGGVLLLAGLALTHTLGMLWHLVRVAGGWAAGFVFDPLVWLGVVLGVAGLGLIVIGRRVSRGSRPQELSSAPASPSSAPAPPASSEDPDIAAVLKKYGIS